MYLLSHLITLWTCSVPSLLVLWLLGRQLELRVGIQMVQTLNCSQWGTPSDRGLFEDGDVIIGGLFSLRYMPPVKDHRFTLQPDNKPCTG